MLYSKKDLSFKNYYWNPNENAAATELFLDRRAIDVLNGNHVLYIANNFLQFYIADHTKEDLHAIEKVLSGFMPHYLKTANEIVVWISRYSNYLSFAKRQNGYGFQLQSR